MTRHGQRSLLEAVALILGVIAVFWTLEEGVRSVEAAVSAWMTAQAPAPGEIYRDGVSILILPSPGIFFRAVLLPSCSGLAAALTMVALLPLGRSSSPSRRIAASLTAAGVIFVGNAVRITTALIYGRYQGRSGLVLFHDLVGGTFTFIYVITGFLVGLSILLPRLQGDPSGSSSTLASTGRQHT
jgi:exosortase/archaeosortase family protein